MEYVQKESIIMWREVDSGIVRTIGTKKYMISKGITKYNLYLWDIDIRGYRLLKSNINLKYAKESALKHYDKWFQAM
jgi:hypothetical protein